MCVCSRARSYGVIPSALERDVIDLGDKEPKRPKRTAGAILMFTETHSVRSDSRGSGGEGLSAEVDPRSAGELAAACGENESLG